MHPGPGGTPTTNPTPEFQVLKGATSTLLIEGPVGLSPDGYCAFAVSGTDNRDDVRASLLTFGSQTIPGTTIPIHSRIVEGH